MMQGAFRHHNQLHIVKALEFICYRALSSCLLLEGVCACAHCSIIQTRETWIREIAQSSIPSLVTMVKQQANFKHFTKTKDLNSETMQLSSPFWDGGGGGGVIFLFSSWMELVTID